MIGEGTRLLSSVVGWGVAELLLSVCSVDDGG